MATPNLDAGVIERGKPFAWPSHLVWRFEAVLGAGSSITSPIFGIVQDGRPLTEIEVGALSGVKVPGPPLRLAALTQAAPNLRLTLQLIPDSGDHPAHRVISLPTASD